MEGGLGQSRSVGTAYTEYLLDGALIGAGAYVAGYLVTVLFTVLDGFEVAGDVPAWTAIGWVFYGAHNVPIETSGGAADELSTESASVFELQGAVAAPISELSSTVPRVLYLLVPVAVLLGAGYVAYRVADERRPGPVRAATLGASVVIGYLSLAVVGAFVFEHSRSLTVQGRTALSFSAGPDLLLAVVLAGLGYPLVLGAIGGLLARQGSANDQARI
ncbi:hypothetical protein BV210_12830 [Halorientalis sp. IM1011]|uniref:hypothetical protein n=1 Tax=Halorientalis sp. IM1011 TaxID=1932360 RepID=UPI00097CC504|nr:hypothetical protein [Halorientalis sp. IM1011]AQL43524.1 hypothetical protein BV210_12830 [Halorientalis sp. IM1011]